MVNDTKECNERGSIANKKPRRVIAIIAIMSDEQNNHGEQGLGKVYIYGGTR